jgi:hypothetical protein
VEGLLLRLLEDKTGAPGRLFWRLFGSIHQDLDRLYWCFANQPWMGAPRDFDQNDLEPFEENYSSSIQLWRPDSLTKYADRFAEEHIELWGIEPTRDHPALVAAEYSDRNWSEEVVRKYARVWLLYSDRTCWEIYARKSALLESVSENLSNQTWVKVFRSDMDRRAWAFGMAGLSDTWKAMQGG